MSTLIAFQNLVWILSSVSKSTKEAPEKMWQQHSMYGRMVDLESWDIDPVKGNDLACYNELIFHATNLIIESI